MGSCHSSRLFLLLLAVAVLCRSTGALVLGAAGIVALVLSRWVRAPVALILLLAVPPLYVCLRCAVGGGTTISLDALRFLRSAAAASPEGLNGIPLDEGPGRELETAHRRLIHLHLEKELKSARVLRQMR